MTSGVVAGLAAGLVFILANMIYATSEGKPAIAPFLAIGTIFFFDDKPMMTLEYALTGVITHLSLSVLFGIIFAMLVMVALVQEGIVRPPQATARRLPAKRVKLMGTESLDDDVAAKRR